MKHIIPVLLFSTILFSCGNNEANKTAEQIKEVTSIQPGSTATSASGYNMRAKINGKEWSAASMMPPDLTGRIIGYQGDEYIGLPYSKSSLTAGKKLIFSEDYATDLALDDDIGIYGGRKGEMEITSVSDEWIEGKFFFTASTSRSDKTVEVTDGFFRIKANGQ